MLSCLGRSHALVVSGGFPSESRTRILLSDRSNSLGLFDSCYPFGAFYLVALFRLCCAPKGVKLANSNFAASMSALKRQERWRSGQWPAGPLSPAANELLGFGQQAPMQGELRGMSNVRDLVVSTHTRSNRAFLARMCSGFGKLEVPFAIGGRSTFVGSRRRGISAA